MPSQNQIKSLHGSPAKITVICPQGHVLKAPARRAGTTARCPHCQTLVAIPVPAGSGNGFAHQAAANKPRHHTRKYRRDDSSSNLLSVFVGIAAVALVFALLGAGAFVIIQTNAGQNNAERDDIRPPTVANQPPTVTIANVTPAQPLLGKSFTIHLNGNDPDGRLVKFECRRNNEPFWTECKDNRITFADLKSGSVGVDVRALDNEGLASSILSKSWTVNRPPTVAIARAQPSQPLVGKPLTIELSGADPDGDALQFEFRTDSKAEWQRTTKSRVILNDLRPGGLLLEVRATDVHGQLSKIASHTWKVVNPNRLPTVEIVRLDPESPVEGKPLSVYLKATDPDNDSTTIQWREGATGKWKEISGNRLDILKLKRGSMKLEFRAVDDQKTISPVVACILSVLRAPHAELLVLKGHTGGVTCVTFSPDGRHALSGSRDKTARIWDLETGMQLKSFGGHKTRGAALGSSRVASVAYSPDGRYALAGGGSNSFFSIRINPRQPPIYKESPHGFLFAIDTQSDRVIPLKGHTGVVDSIAVLPDNKTVVTGGGGDGTIRRWNLEPGGQISSLKIISGNGRIFVTPDGRLAVTDQFANRNRLVNVWSATSGAKLNRVDGIKLNSTFALSASGRHGLFGHANRMTKDYAILLMDLQSSKVLKRLTGPTGFSKLAISPNGRLALSGGGDKTIRLWDLQSGKVLHQFEGHAGGVSCLAFSPDGRHFLSGHSDKTVRLWKIPGPEIVAASNKEKTAGDNAGKKRTVPNKTKKPQAKFPIDVIGKWLYKDGIVEYQKNGILINLGRKLTWSVENGKMIVAGGQPESYKLRGHRLTTIIRGLPVGALRIDRSNDTLKRDARFADFAGNWTSESVKLNLKSNGKGTCESKFGVANRGIARFGFGIVKLWRVEGLCLVEIQQHHWVLQLSADRRSIQLIAANEHAFSPHILTLQKK